jgi:two-component system, OmpR family, response regulator
VAVTEASILIVEDDLEMRTLLVRGLREEGFHAQSVATGSRLLERAPSVSPDLFIIDIGLPDADGRDVCQALRAQGITAPVMFLTARDALPDRISGFNAGGDDYLTKPFAFAELVVRLEALLRRGGGEPAAAVGGLRLDPSAHTATCGDVSVALTPTEFRLLARLAATPGKVVRRHVLVEVGWPHGAFVQENTLDAYIARLRRKLSELPDAPRIVTAHGLGYRMQ